MALPQSDSSTGCTFGFEADNIRINHITEISGLDIKQQVITLKQNTADGKYETRQLPGRWETPKLTLIRGLTEDTSFEKWIKDAQFGKMGEARKGAAIIVYDFEGNPIRRYKLTNAWAAEYSVSAMKAGDTSVLTEKLVVVCDRLEFA